MSQKSQHSGDFQPPIALAEHDALLIVDLQNCFLPGGSLGVSRGDRVIEPLNDAIQIFLGKNLPVFLSRDWHPPNHISFKEQGGPWPDHCVQNTEGAEFSSLLKIPAGALVFSKGSDPDREEYSAWRAKGEDGLTLRDHIVRLGIRRLFIGGLATEYCVLNTVKDVRQEGYETFVFVDAVQAVNASECDDEKAFAEMASAGAKFLLEKDIRS